MRRPQPPRRARRLLAPITSPPVSGFITYGRLAAPTLHNEAESGSLALRLTGSPHEASPHGLLRLTLARLPVEWAIDRVSSFQPTRSARFILALHTLPFMYAPTHPSAGGLRPGYRSGSWGGPGVADMKGNVGATRRRTQLHPQSRWATRSHPRSIPSASRIGPPARPFQLARPQR